MAAEKYIEDIACNHLSEYFFIHTKYFLQRHVK